ncbi:MAG: outer membrane protein assembly factor BamA, partial [Bacteroidales bacterium]|nr:outer membrane protein assembly factor BamA [Bacteroidales bacterium]
MSFRRIFSTFVLALTISNAFSNDTNVDSTIVADYAKPKEYIIDTVTISGVRYLDQRVLANMSGLATGTSITLPGDEISKIVRKFWEHGLFEDVKVTYQITSGNRVAIDIYLKERPRIANFTIEGVSKSDQKDLKEKLNFRVGSQLTENVINDAVTIVRKFYREKGFFNVQVEINYQPDTARPNAVSLNVKITKNKRVKIKDIVFTGNQNIKSSTLRRAMKDTKRRDWKFWNSSKYIEPKYQDDKAKIIDLYNEKGFRDAKILSDSIEMISDKRIILHINIYEGRKYFFRNINWVGNTKYPSDMLSNILGIKKGDVFNQKTLDKRLQSDDDAVSSLYLDNGYLFFNVTPVETKIENDSIDFEMRIYEGKQATFNSIIITGNTKTNEHVARRELRTLPGELFSKSDIVRSVRELATLGLFEPEKIEPVPIPNPANSTVDLQYKLTERASDQLELSGGWGGYYRFIGSIGISFNNFSYRNFFNWKEWRPVPSGDGQSLSFRFQTNGKQYMSLSSTFSDPWFGGKKPNAFSLTLFYSHYNRVEYNSIKQLIQATDSYFDIMGASVSLGKRLKWPDDYFTLQQSVGIDRYKFRKYPIVYNDSTGSINSIYYSVNFGRNSLDQYIYPRTGSWFSIGLKLTPPYSLLNNKDYSKLSPSEKYKWAEFHKWTLRAETYMTLVGNLVFMTRANFGILGRYKKSTGYAPVEQYNMGGSGMMSYNITNSEIIPMRGYTDEALTPTEKGIYAGRIYDRFTAELRYPITLKEQATIYGTLFAEAGNCWSDIRYFNPFDVKR